MTTTEFIYYLKNQQVELCLDGDDLRVRAPKDTVTPELRDELLERKREVLVYLRNKENSSRPDTPQIEKISRDQPLRLSAAQERLWLLNQLEPKSPAYNIPGAVRLLGPLDKSALQRSFEEIIRRHESLRTHFEDATDQPRQVIDPPSSLDIEQVDLSSFSDDEQPFQANRYILQETLRCFDLSRSPLLRVALLTLGEDHHILVLTLQHIIADGWSLGIFIKEFGQVYQALTKGEEPALPPLSIQYADYAHWQRQRLEDERMRAQLSYWEDRLAAPPTLEMPFDYPRPLVQSYHGTRLRFRIEGDLLEKLRTLADQQDATLFMVLLSAYKLLLHKYSGQQDIAVGSPIANRKPVETEGLIGCFVNTLVYRNRIDPEKTFGEFLREVRETAFEAYENQDVPFEKVVEALNPERSLSQSPLFQTMFILQNAPTAKLGSQQLRVEPIELQGSTAKFDLSLAMTQKGNELTAAFDYNTSLFSKSTIEALAKRFQTLLDEISMKPETLISGLSMIDELERDRLLNTWNATSTDHDLRKSVQRRFEEQVVLTPEDTAVTFGSETLTYGDLNARANQLAHHLIQKGVGPESLVGLCVTRSLDMVTGLLAILKAGGAYVPIDPAFPEQRIAIMVDDACPLLILSQERLSALLPDSTPVIFIDTDWQDIAGGPVDNPPVEVEPNNLAYVIFTSGSTGRPKGVAISHAALTNFLGSMQTEPGIDASDRLLSVTTISFDIAALEVFLPLVCGAHLILAAAETTVDGTMLNRLLDESDATIMQATPATWDLLLEAGWVGKKGLKILCGGEAMSTNLAEQLLSRTDSLWNLYGPTETTIWSTIHRVAGVSQRSIPIGRPIANTQVFILDTNLQPVPSGVFGELYIGGAGLARCYLNRPQETAQRFMPSPFAGDENARLYRTGDRARFLPDGTLEYGGRLDSQVKVRGFRIELGEIEAALRSRPAIQDAAVVVRNDATRGKQLAAFLVHRGNELPDSQVVRNFLSSKLPEYMIPAVFSKLDSLPLTPNGKIDRRLLAAQAERLDSPKSRFVAAATPLEKYLAEVWCEILGLERVSVNDNFFELGGHSLLATRIITRLRDAFDVNLPLIRLFESPTVAGVTQALLDTSGDPPRIEKTADILLKLSHMSDSEVQETLATKTPSLTS